MPMLIGREVEIARSVLDAAAQALERSLNVVYGDAERATLTPFVRSTAHEMRTAYGPCNVPDCGFCQ